LTRRRKEEHLKKINIHADTPKQSLKTKSKIDFLNLYFVSCADNNNMSERTHLAIILALATEYIRKDRRRKLWMKG
jgi:hypothetical protein